MLDEQDATNRDGKGKFFFIKAQRASLTDFPGLPFTIRTVFIIDPKKAIRLTLSYPAAVGRNFDEILR